MKTRLMEMTNRVLAFYAKLNKKHLGITMVGVLAICACAYSGYSILAIQDDSVKKDAVIEVAEPNEANAAPTVEEPTTVEEPATEAPVDEAPAPEEPAVVEPTPEPEPEQPAASKETVSESSTEGNWKSLGTFKITAYYFGEDSYGDTIARPCGKDGHKKAIVGHTVAVDPKVIPYGTEIMIDGHVYVAEDCGGAVKGNIIDVWVAYEENGFCKYSEVFVRQ